LDFRRFEIARDLLDKTHHVALRLMARATECELLVLAVLLHELEISRIWPEQMLLAIPRWAERAADLVGTERYPGLEAGIAASLSDALYVSPTLCRSALITGSGTGTSLIWIKSLRPVRRINNALL
jgi:hypothetical protein